LTEDLDQSDGVGGKHLAARQLAERALQAQADGDSDEADRLFAKAERADPQAVIAVLEERGASRPGTSAMTSDTTPQDDNEIAAMSRTIEPGSAAPSRSGVSGRGTGADTEGT